MKATAKESPSIHAPALVAWFQQARRDLPWRQPNQEGFRDPYRVWISEIMLQQTQVDSVMGHFQAWMRRFPSVASLAQADEAEVLQLWQGLGYYSRARNILRAARILTAQHQGEFPRTRKALEALPGIGAYTAGAILSLAYHLPEPILDGNLVRVFSRLHGWNFLPDTALHKQNYWKEAAQWSLCGPPQLVNEALMELGALVCKPQNPLCPACPLQSNCKIAPAQNWQSYPPRKSMDITPWEGFALLCESPEGELYCVRDPDAPFLKGQCNFPLRPVQQITGKNPTQIAAQLLGIPPDRLLGDATWVAKPVRHAITRYRISIQIVHLRLDDSLQLPGQWIDKSAIPDHIVNSLGLKIWKRCPD